LNFLSLCVRILNYIIVNNSNGGFYELYFKF